MYLDTSTLETDAATGGQGKPPPSPFNTSLSPPESPQTRPHVVNNPKFLPGGRRVKGTTAEFLRSCRRGDYSKISQLLDEEPDLDVNYTDSLGRSALRLAVKNDHLEIVEQLLPRSTPANVYEALLLSITLDHDHISEAILRHPVYQQCHGEDSTELGGASVLDHHFDLTPDDTLFAADVTPLVLAAQRNQFEIVRILLELGERIDETHSFDCKCPRCRGSPNFDELRFAKTRLNTYKGLASEAYISLSSADPILTAFQLARKLRKLGHIEKYFKADYQTLAANLSNYVNKLLDKIRDGDELGAVLDAKEGISTESEEGSLSRLKLAVHFREKKFVAHPSCQKKLTSVWYGKLRFLEQTPIFLFLLFTLGLTFIYPFLVVLYWIYPYGRIGEFLRTPLIKFLSSTCSYIAFVCMIIAYSVTEQAAAGYSISEHDRMGPRYAAYILQCQEMHGGNTTLCQEDVSVRYHRLGYGTVVLSFWILGLVWQACKRLYIDKFVYFFESWYNISDMVMYASYITSFTLRYLCIIQITSAIKDLGDNPWDSLLYRNESSKNIQEWIYWVTADRSEWDSSDMYFISEALFAVANILSVCRLTYLFAVNDRMGPLLISLTRMILDVFVFMFIFILIISAFVIGFHNLLWYYEPSMMAQAKSMKKADLQDTLTIDTSQILWLVYWSIFGMVEMQQEDFIFYMFDQKITKIVSNIMFAVYNWIIVVVLINMLIAMMARSYEIIAADEDMEWKFTRSKLYLEYIKSGGNLSVPFNIMPTWKDAVNFLKRICPCCRKIADQPEKANAQATIGETIENTKAMDTLSPQSTYTSNRGSKANGRNPHPLRQKDSAVLVLPQFIQDAPDDLSIDELVISRVLKRYLAQGVNKKTDPVQKGEDPALSSHDTLKRDLSNFRYEVMNAFRRQDLERRDVVEKVSKVEQSSHTAAEKIASMVDEVSMQDPSHILGRDIESKAHLIKEQSVDDGDGFGSRASGIASVSGRVDDLNQKVEQLAADSKALTTAVMEMKQMLMSPNDVFREHPNKGDDACFISDMSKPTH